MTDELFRVIEPSGKTCRIFTDGHVVGFEPGAVIANFFRTRASQRGADALAKERSMAYGGKKKPGKKKGK